MSTDAETRVRLRAALAQSASALAIAPTEIVDIYQREAQAILHADKARETAIDQIQKRMALEIDLDTPECVTFVITDSSKYNQLAVYFKHGHTVSYQLKRVEDGDGKVEAEDE